MVGPRVGPVSSHDDDLPADPLAGIVSLYDSTTVSAEALLAGSSASKPVFMHASALVHDLKVLGLDMCLPPAAGPAREKEKLMVGASSCTTML